ncbi:MAG: hypothetical protein M1818_002080 [Claussenomyces sp. TS43310]|nr:MAG: hypothetical protein M1818_002080 [Claussenomyces sp. TS43310]
MMNVVAHHGVIWATLALLVCLRIVFAFVQARSQARRSAGFGCKPAVKRPRNRWLCGIDLALQKLRSLSRHTYLEDTTRLHTDVGATFEETMWGSTAIVTIEPENVKAIMATQFNDFELSDQRIRAFEPLTGQGIFSSNGAVWAHGRSIVRPIFTRTQIANLDVYERHFQNFLALIPRDGSTVDMQPLFQRLTFDTASEILFGESIHTLVSDPSEHSKAVAEAYSRALTGIVTRVVLGPLISLHSWIEPKFFSAIKTLDDYIDSFVDQALKFREATRKGATAVQDEKDPDCARDDKEATNKKNYVFLQELAKDTDDRKVLRDQLLSLLSAGRDTTASLLSSIFWCLAHNPSALQNLREEVAKLDGKRPSYQELKDMTYLRWVLNETLRLIPPVVAIIRSAKQDTFLPVGGGPDGKSRVFVRKGQTVMYRIWALHRSVPIWGPDAPDFRPERWVDAAKLTSWRLVSFSGGPRICPGQTLALTEAGYTTVRLLQTFSKMEHRDNGPYREMVGAVLQHRDGVKVSLTE